MATFIYTTLIQMKEENACYYGNIGMFLSASDINWLTENVMLLMQSGYISRKFVDSVSPTKNKNIQ